MLSASLILLDNQLLGGYSVNSAYYAKFNFGYDLPKVLTDELLPDLPTELPTTSSMDSALMTAAKPLMTAATFADMNSMYHNS